MVINTIHRYIFLTFIIFQSSLLLAQNYSISSFSSKDGLAQTKCRVLSKDFRGNIWVGTFEGGLSRFDGHKFVNYSTREGLANNFVYDILPDQKNQIWVATGNGISMFNGDSFTNYLSSDEEMIEISALAMDTLNVLWFFQKGKGLGKLTEGEVSFILNKNLTQLKVNALYVDSSNRVWIGTQNNGAFFFDGTQFQQLSVEDGLSNQTVHSFFENGEDIYIGTASGISIFNDGKLRSDNSHLNLQYLAVYDFHLDDDHRIWYATNNGAWYEQDTSLVNIKEINGLVNTVLSIEGDNDKGIWFCSYNGLSRLDNELFLTYNQSHALSGNIINSIAIDSQKNVWVTNENGVNIISGNRVNSPPDLPAELSSNPGPIVADKEGNIYIGSFLSIFKYDGNTFQQFIKEDELVEDEKYLCAFITSTGEVLFGGTNGISIYKDNSLKSLISSSQLKSYHAKTITEDRAGNILIGTNGGGVFLYNKEGISQYGLKEGLPNGVVNCINIDNDLNIWLGTIGNGIIKIPNGDFTEKAVTYDDLAIVSSNVYSIIIDDSGNIWLGTDRGLNKLLVIQNDNVKVITYVEKEGFSPLEVYPNAFVKDQDGMLWLGTVEGLVKINPNKEAYTLDPPFNYFEGLKLFFEEPNWAEYSDNINLWSGMPDQLELPFNKNHLLFQFVGISMNAPTEVTYQWKLDGLDMNWTPPSHQGEAIYPNIPPGKYTFMVKSCNAGGICSNTPASFSFVIVKPFYQTRAFVIACVLLGGGIFYYFSKRRFEKLQQSQEILRSKVKQRTAEIESQKTEIDEQKVQLEDAIHKIEKTNSELHQVNEDMTNSLKYAGRIQSAILSYHQTFHKYFPNSFILSLNRRIVTGDFIWLREKDDHIYLGIVDCTGSGVPAAFMSIIGFDYLNEILDNADNLDPASILKQLNKEVIDTLHTKEANIEGELNDGMDVGLCKINKKTHEMVFAGARRPIILIKNDEIMTLKGDFFSVGIDYTGMEASFKNQTIQLDKETIVYLFSDGYHDQFGESGKKYKVSSFKKLLVDINSLDMKEQEKTLKEEYYRWKGKAEQMDDVLVAGFRISD